MAFAASFGRLISVLSHRVPEKARALAREHRRVKHGLVSVGLKLHCLGGSKQFEPLINALGGPTWVTDRNLYKHADASFCLVLPPVGSADVAVTLLECLADY